MNDPIIKIKNLSKKYRIRHQTGTSYLALRDEIINLVRKPIKWIFGFRETKEDFWALQNINLEVQKGEVLGIIGANGAGKSTLLKILSKITFPTGGEAVINGKVSSLLEVGTGFHPELTGRENIYLNGAILGMTKKEITRKFDDIVEFSGIERFLDTPVKRYSSGMSVRLAFAVAAHLDPDILLVDEVLAVGDAEFQKKSLGKMEEVTRAGKRTILFVSHNMSAVQGLCDRSVVLEKGRVAFIGPTHKAIEKYLDIKGALTTIPLEDRKDRSGDGKIRFTSVEILNKEDGHIKTGKPFTIRASFEKNEPGPVKNVAFSFAVNSPTGGHMIVFWTETSGFNASIDQDKGAIECEVDRCPLIAGRYPFNAFCSVNDITSDSVANVGEILVDDSEYFSKGRRDHELHPKYVVDHKWKLIK